VLFDKVLDEECDKPEDQRIKRARYYEIKERTQMAYNKDMAASAAIPSTGSSSSSPRYEGYMTKNL
jgi:regulatory protein NPR1